MKRIQINHKSPIWQSWKALVITVLVFQLAFLLAGQRVQAIPNNGYARPEVLIQPEELKNFIDTKNRNFRVVDVRQKLKYLSAHISEAVHVWRLDITDENHPIPGMMAPKEHIETLMGNLGISHQNTVVIYSDGPDNGRLWWILAYYGFPLNQMKILDGGIEAWKRKGYPMDIAPPSLERTRFKFEREVESRKPLLCNLREVKEALEDRQKVVLDVRSEKEYLGEETKSGATRPGRVPGVKWIEWTETLVGEGPYKGYWKSGEKIRKIFSNEGVTPEKDIFLY